MGHRAAIYCRVSTADQSCERQEFDLRAFAGRAGYDVVGIFKETGSGTKLGTVAKLAMRQPFVLFKGLTFQKLCLPGAFRPGDHHN
ncbi:recombinase family protein, partial [Citrobacter cronae]|uniref:recombinase family protein n=1 Tax=Citrobacter cronae TaxID=1748967 RepID=UPI00350F2B00